MDCLQSYPSIWKSSICAANFVGNSVASNLLMVLTPLLPANNLQQEVTLWSNRDVSWHDVAHAGQSCLRIVECVHIIAKA